jgi:hypothetical protein
MQSGNIKGLRVPCLQNMEKTLADGTEPWACTIKVFYCCNKLECVTATHFHCYKTFLSVIYEFSK